VVQLRLRSLVLLTALFLGAGMLAVPARAAACTDPDPITRHWCELGGAGSVVGAPVGPAYAVGGGRGQDFAAGSIYWSPATGAHEVHGAITVEYARLGGPVGRAGLVLGFPLTDETGTPDGVGRYNLFQGGSIYFTPSTGAQEVHGAIAAEWASLGWERGVLGYPVTGEAVAPDGVGRYSHFQGGSIYWTPATGAHEVHGGIRAEWAALGWERSLLGYPLTDETATPDGVGRYNLFQGGSIYWTPATGAHEVHGGIRAEWAALGWERSALGYPISDEYAVPGGRQSDFQGGFLRWDATTGAVTRAVLAPYQHAGTWVTRFRFAREYAGANPPTTPAQVDAMADAGVRTLYLQAAADDPAYPGLLSPDLLGQFLVRAHARGMQVVAWYLPHFTDVPADLRRLQAMAAFRAGGHAFDALAVDIEDRTVVDVDVRNAALVDLSARLRGVAPGVTLGAIVLPPVVTEVLSPTYWPRFPWRQLGPLYQVWLPMAYWSNRTADSPYRDAYRYTSENIARVRADLGEPCAAVSVVGGFGSAVTGEEYAAMARAAADQGAAGVSVFDWATTPASAWPPLRGYDVRGC
jgi:hypothetical protein